MREVAEIPEDWQEPSWTKRFNRSELAWLVDQYHQRNERLQIERNGLRAEVTLYRNRERNNP